MCSLKNSLWRTGLTTLTASYRLAQKKPSISLRWHVRQQSSSVSATVAMTAVRHSMSGAVRMVGALSAEGAEDLARALAPEDRERLREALVKVDREEDEQRRNGVSEVTDVDPGHHASTPSPSSDSTVTGIDASKLGAGDAKALFMVNAVPFVGFGVLDNGIMIIAGEYIDQSLGLYLCLSTMAAAAIGNMISDVAGIGLAHYVEAAVARFGIRHPTLNAQQFNSARARLAVNVGRAFGLVVGCTLGMFPLLFFEDDKKNTVKAA